MALYNNKAYREEHPMPIYLTSHQLATCGRHQPFPVIGIEEWCVFVYLPPTTDTLLPFGVQALRVSKSQSRTLYNPRWELSEHFRPLNLGGAMAVEDNACKQPLE
jgi:hypothetical protein